MVDRVNFKRILVVCVGNICRSPIAEVMLQQQLPSVVVKSAGLGALVGHEKHIYADLLLRENGYEVNEHNARQLNGEMLVEADLIFVMEKKHQNLLMNAHPQVVGKVFLLGKWQGDLEIADPYQKSLEFFTHVFHQIEVYTKDWVQKVIKST